MFKITKQILANEKGFLTKIFVWHKQGIPTIRRIAKIKLFKHKNQISELHDLRMVNISGVSWCSSYFNVLFHENKSHIN